MTHSLILKLAGFPTTAVVLDFETFFDKEYRMVRNKLSTIEYVMDPRFKFTGVGYQVLGKMKAPSFAGQPNVQWVINHLREQFGEQLEGCTIIGQNLRFDALILKEKFSILPPFMVDTRDLSRHLDARNSHKLKDLNKRWGRPPKGDITQFLGLYWNDMTEEQREALQVYTNDDVADEAWHFGNLLPRISRPDVELPLINQTLRLFLEPKLQIDIILAKHIHWRMGMEKDKAVKATGLTQKVVNGNIKFPKLLQEALDPFGKSVPLKKSKPRKDGSIVMIPALAKDDEAMQELLLHSDEKVRLLCQARKAVKSWPLHQKKVMKLIQQANARGGASGVPLNYYGGHTGRWSGAEGVNFQNLGGQGRGAPLHPLIGQVRGTIQAGPGRVLGILDWRQIEARILAWFAGQEDLLEGFANGDDIYSAFATGLFGHKVWNPDKDDDSMEAKQAKIERGFGKDAILGCGYGMGAAKFYGNCRKNPDLRPLIDNGRYTKRFISDMIKKYRQTYSLIPTFWTTVEKAFRTVTKYYNEVRNVGLLKFHNAGNHEVIITLPSGRELHYPDACAPGGKIKYHWGHLWGGSITENIVQATARDILAWALLQPGIDPYVVFHVHDEIIVLLENAEWVQADLRSIQGIMETGPSWASGIPLEVESFLSERYAK
jgi:DNA polymerase